MVVGIKEDRKRHEPDGQNERQDTLSSAGQWIRHTLTTRLLFIHNVIRLFKGELISYQDNASVCLMQIDGEVCFNRFQTEDYVEVRKPVQHK